MRPARRIVGLAMNFFTRLCWLWRAIIPSHWQLFANIPIVQQFFMTIFIRTKVNICCVGRVFFSSQFSFEWRVFLLGFIKMMHFVLDSLTLFCRFRQQMFTHNFNLSNGCLCPQKRFVKKLVVVYANSPVILGYGVSHQQFKWQWQYLYLCILPKQMQCGCLILCRIMLVRVCNQTTFKSHCIKCVADRESAPGWIIQ